ncbi:hypothetical protein SFRURICE_011855 [Spodoptera frugiperda]|nr:hypothetical protein SFRURICE_011855 [Spodoptera frugiperda]
MYACLNCTCAKSQSINPLENAERPTPTRTYYFNEISNELSATITCKDFKMNKMKQAKLKKKKKKKNNINKHKRNCEPVNISTDLVAALTALRLDGKPRKKVKSKKKSKKVKAKPVAQEQIAGTSDQPTPQQKAEHCAWNLDCSHMTTTNGPSM